MKLPQRCFCLTVILMALVVSTLTACSHVKGWNPDDYTVKSGDTLYSIAWRYELDTEDFAPWNHISLSAPIKPGQRLHTRKPANFKAPRSAARTQAISSTTASWPQAVPGTGRVPAQKWVKARKGDSLYGLSRRYSVDVKRLAQLNQLAPPYVIKPGQTSLLKPRSEEHTSELQSPCNLVCRLLLEKKKKITQTTPDNYMYIYIDKRSHKVNMTHNKRYS